MLFLLALVQVASASLATVHRGFGQKVNHSDYLGNIVTLTHI